MTGQPPPASTRPAQPPRGLGGGGTDHGGAFLAQQSVELHEAGDRRSCCCGTPARASGQPGRDGHVRRARRGPASGGRASGGPATRSTRAAAAGADLPLAARRPGGRLAAAPRPARRQGGGSPRWRWSAEPADLRLPLRARRLRHARFCCGCGRPPDRGARCAPAGLQPGQPGDLAGRLGNQRRHSGRVAQPGTCIQRVPLVRGSSSPGPIAAARPPWAGAVAPRRDPLC